VQFFVIRLCKNGSRPGTLTIMPLIIIADVYGAVITARPFREFIQFICGEWQINRGRRYVVGAAGT